MNLHTTKYEFYKLLALYKTPHFFWIIASVLTLGIGVFCWILDAMFNCMARNGIRESYGARLEVNFAAVLFILIILALVSVLFALLVTI